MTQVAGDVRAPAPVQPAWRRATGSAAGRFPEVKVGARAMEIDFRLTGMILALIAIWLGLRLCVGRPVPDAAQPLRRLRPERAGGDHGHGHGPHHRFTEHRPFGRLGHGSDGPTWPR